MIIDKDYIVGAFFSKYDGISSAKGKYVYVVDSDDIIENGAFSGMINLAKETDADIVYGNYVVEYKKHTDNLITENIDADFVANKDAVMCKILSDKLVQGFTFWVNIFKKSLFDETQIKKLDKEILDDVYMVPLIYYAASKVSHYDHVIYRYSRINTDSLTSNGQIRPTAHFKTYNALYDYFKDREPQYLPSIQFLKAQFKIHILRNCRTKQNFKDYHMLFPEINLEDYKQTFSPFKRLVWATYKICRKFGFLQYY